MEAELVVASGYLLGNLKPKQTPSARLMQGTLDQWFLAKNMPVSVENS